MGISVQAVGAIVNGKSKSATAENNVSAAAYFGCDANWLATGKGEPGWRPDFVLTEGGRVTSIIESKAPRPMDTAPPPPDPKFTDRRTPPTDSEWAILDAIRAFPQEERDRVRDELKDKASYWERIAKELLKQRTGI